MALVWLDERNQMRNFCIAFLFFLASSIHAEEKLSISEWLDVFIDACVGGGSSSVSSGSIDAGAGISLKKLTLEGKLEGQVKLTRSNYRLLSEGISNALGSVAADEADKVRDCLAPIRRNLLQAMNQQMGGGGATAGGTVYILSPYEEKIMKSLATHVGEGGKTGQYVLKTTIMADTHMSDLRFNSTMRMLESKALATAALPYLSVVGPAATARIETSETVTLFNAGEEYVLEAGYAR